MQSVEKTIETERLGDQVGRMKRRQNGTGGIESFSTELLDPLLPFLGISISCRTETSLVSSNETTDDFVFADVVDGVVVAFCGPRSGVEFRPVDL